MELPLMKCKDMSQLKRAHWQYSGNTMNVCLTLLQHLDVTTCDSAGTPAVMQSVLIDNRRYEEWIKGCTFKTTALKHSLGVLLCCLPPCACARASSPHSRVQFILQTTREAGQPREQQGGQHTEQTHPFLLTGEGRGLILYSHGSSSACTCESETSYFLILACAFACQGSKIDKLNGVKLPTILCMVSTAHVAK